jgi:hypothetical protein
VFSAPQPHSLTDAVVLVPGTASVLGIAELRAATERSTSFRNLLARHEQAVFAPAQHPPRAMRLTRSKHACHAGCCARDLCNGQSLALTEELLGQIIGVQRNAISMVAHALQSAGIIRYSRGQIEITDLEGLKATCCECYHAVKAQRDRLLKVPDGISRNDGG